MPTRSRSPAIDWYYVFRSLKIGGRLLLDDIPVPAVASVFHFMQSEPNWRLDSIHDQRTALFTLVSEAAPEDWTFQPFNRRLDFAFAPFPDRVRLHTAEYVRELRQYVSRPVSPGSRRVASSPRGPPRLTRACSLGRLRDLRVRTRRFGVASSDGGALPRRPR